MKRRIPVRAPLPDSEKLVPFTVTIVRPQREVLNIAREPSAARLLQLDLGKSFDKLKKNL